MLETCRSLYCSRVGIDAAIVSSVTRYVTGSMLLCKEEGKWQRIIIELSVEMNLSLQ